MLPTILFLSLSIQPTAALSVPPPLRTLGQNYAALSTAHPLATAAATAGSILCLADLTCQSFLETNSTLDVRRTAALALFGTWHYGFPAKSLYLFYDRLLGVDGTLRTALFKVLLDEYVHTPLLLIPSFYMITGLIRGRSLAEALSQLRREWFVASFGSALFWTPLQLVNFLFVPQHSRIVFIAVFSFLHKTWLSWLSNRQPRRESEAM